MLTEMFQIFDSDPLRLLPRNTAMRWQKQYRIKANYLRLYYGNVRCVCVESVSTALKCVE